MAQPDAFWSGGLAAAATSGQDLPLFALDGETVCGLLWCKLSATEAGVANLFQMWVEPALRGQGAGGALLDAAMDWARRVGAQRVRLSVTEGDSPARRLYEGRGFGAVGPLRELREKSGIGAQSMELQLLGNSLGSAPA